jgi:hypothetical protein
VQIEFLGAGKKTVRISWVVSELRIGVIVFTTIETD